MSTILDLHTHSEASEDSRAPVEAYLNWIKLRATERPVDGIVLTEHRQFNRAADYRALEDKFGTLVLRASEVETNYGHMLVFGVNDDMVKRFDFADVHLDAQTLINEVARMGGIVVPCHPGRPNIGLYEHYQSKRAAGERGRSRGAQRRIAQGRGRAQRGVDREVWFRGDRRIRQPSGESDRIVRDEVQRVYQDDRRPGE